MPTINDPDDLNQGASTAVADMRFSSVSGRQINVDSAGTNLPDLEAGVYFEIRGATNAENSGLYRVDEANPTTTLIVAFKISGPAPTNDAVDNTGASVLATTATPKSVHFDVNARDIYLLEEGSLDETGATLQALYSFIKLRWKDDNELIKHPFPMIAITSEQFEFIDDWNLFDAADIGPFAATDGFDWLDGGGSNDTLENDDAVENDWVVLGFRVGDDMRVVTSDFEPDRTFSVLVITDGLGTNDVVEFATGTLTGGTNDDDNGAVVRGAIRSRKLIRTGGWSEVAETGSILERQYPGVITLGSFEDPLDNAYFAFANDPTDVNAAVNFDFTDAVNEAVLSYIEIGLDATGYDFNDDSPDTIDRNDGGSFIDDGYQVGGQVTVRAAGAGGDNGTFEITVLAAGTMTVQAQGGGDAGLTGATLDQTAQLSVNNRNLFAPRIRIRDGDPEGKTFDASNLADIGITGFDDFDNRVFRFPLGNDTDLKISATDATIAGTPWSEVRLRYLAEAYNRGVDSATLRDYGIVIDVGTYSQANGVSAGSTLVTSASLNLGAGEALADYTGGDLILHDATAPDRATHTIVGTPVDNGGVLEITISGALTNSESSLSFTMERATPLTATAEEIYEKIQFQLRQDADIDETANVVNGRTADALLTFIGDSLNVGETDTSLPANPNGGGTGVIIEGFDSNDTNRMTFFDNIGVGRTFPFVAAGTINFNDNLQNDSGPAEFFMFYEFTRRTTNSDIDTVGPSGDTYDLEGTLGTYIVGDYLRVSGFVQDANNGIFIVTVVNVSGSDYTVRRVDGQDVGTAETNQTVSVDENPIDSPQAILVQDNSSADITGVISGPSVAFDFDYDNNVQGGRTQGTDADIVIRAIGEDTAAFVEVFGTITRATGLTFSVVAPLERNFSNP